MGSSRTTTERQRREHAAYAPARDEPRVLLTTDEAAAYLRLSPRTLERYRVTGGGAGAYVKLGRRVFYEKRALDDWLELRRRRSTSDPGPPPPRS